MTRVSDLHNFRVQTPSFLIAAGCSELSDLQQQRLLVEDLSREASVQRIFVSQAIEELKKFINEREPEDYLLVGFPPHKSNPYKDSSSCSLL